jgi:hypothetical protein
LNVGVFNGLDILAGRLRCDDAGVYPIPGGFSFFNFGTSLLFKSALLPEGLATVSNDCFLRMLSLISF